MQDMRAVAGRASEGREPPRRACPGDLGGPVIRPVATAFGQVAEIVGAGSLKPIVSDGARVDFHPAQQIRAACRVARLGPTTVTETVSSGHDVAVPAQEWPSLMLQMGGRSRVRHGRIIIRARAGDGLIMPPGSRRSRAEAANKQAFRGLCIPLPKETVAQAWRGIGPVHLRGDTAAHATLLGLVRLLYAEIEGGSRLLSRPSVSEGWINLLVEAVAQAAETAVLGGRGEPVRRAAQLVQQAEDAIQADLAEIASPTDLALRCGVSLRTLQAAFAAERGHSPQAALNLMRLHAVRRSLADRAGPDTVTEAYGDCGVNHHSRFSAAYKRQFGEYPSETLKNR
ncbi:hypothetical protein DRV85_14290 [Rhodosalinus halophilus]|uniref:HTH araC/xylS-type domain-containing protein n=1 Tax=Rhodosalinus halophilus TaxID=2259333 RepID=A0A365U846_9RHOB|nr:helix-turn-helix transcriptional regulator [Rhodosalinus halophilus]RBI83819.1 hypothetical protein DRV85_14290 [Rhodosalinus halophilus]